MSQQPPTQKRQRGRILSDQGWEKLQAAMERYQEEEKVKLTNEKIADLAELGIPAVSKVLNREQGVDKSSLDNIFRRFSLKLEQNDWHYCGNSPLDSPSALSIDTDLYVERPLIEPRCYREILLPGAVIRIKAPWQMGKTSLSNKILRYAQRQGYRTVALSLRMAPQQFLTNPDRLLRWFCACVSKELNQLGLPLQLPSKLEDYWDDTFGYKISCKDYFQENLLANIPINSALVLGLDEVDLVFRDSVTADEFFDFLRDCHEAAKRQNIWEKLRVVLAYSRPIRISDIYKSAFNVGLEINLPELEQEEVHNLAQQYGLDWDTGKVEQLMNMVGGHPYLVQTAIKEIHRQDITLEEILKTAFKDTGIYHTHLQNLLNILRQQTDLKVSMKKVVDATNPVSLEEEYRNQLYSMGLVKIDKEYTFSRCQLYRQYFQERLHLNE